MQSEKKIGWGEDNLPPPVMANYRVWNCSPTKTIVPICGMLIIS